MHIGILGSSGRLGSLIHEILNSEELSSTSITRNHLQSNEFFQEVINALPAGSVLLDVSLPEATDTLLRHLLSLETEQLQKITGLIIGTTGHSLEQKDKINQLATKLPICVVSNFSKGIFLFEEILKAKTTTGSTVVELARALGFDLALNEIHHNLKKDAPSGTAITIADKAQLTLEKISSTRVGTVVGEHTLYFSQESELFELKHIAHNRKLFASGAVLLCKNIAKKKPMAGLLRKEDFFT